MRKRAQGAGEPGIVASPAVTPLPGFEALLDQEKPVRRLIAALGSGHLPHAFLFTGIEGVGKKTAAIAIAMACNCRNQQRDPNSSNGYAVLPCGECSVCKKIISGSHPDVHVIRPTGTAIKVDQVRSLCERLALRPYEARLRVALIADAQLLNPEAGNMLLKILEEPPDRTVFILTALQPSDLLPTIRSRCQHIRFNPISKKSLQSYLANTLGYEPGKANAVASMAGGSMTRARSMIESDWIEKRNWIIDEIESLKTASVSRCLFFSETLAEDKQLLPVAFEAMKNWFRDLVVYRYSPNQVINQDLLDRIHTASKQAAVEELLVNIKEIEKAEHDIRANANPRLTLDALVIRLFKDNSSHGKNRRRTV